MFKKKPLKFNYEKVSRDMRHAEALRARESSRFERLSMIRNINDSDSNEKSMEAPKENRRKAPEKKPSRLEMLFKWKQEKQIKKEMEKLAKKKPFYTAGNKNLSQNLKSSFVAQSNSSSFNSSKLAKSKLATPTVTTKPSRILNPKQGIPSSTVQPNVRSAEQGVPTSTFQSSRIPNSKQGTPNAASQLSKFANSKQTLLPKTGSNLCRSNSTATLLRKIPASTNNKASSKPGSSLSRSNSTATGPRKFANPPAIDKATASKASSSQKVPIFNRFLNNCTNGAKALLSKDAAKPVYKGSSGAKFPLKPLEEKPVKKVGIGLPKITSNTNAVSKGILIQNKLPVSSIDKKFGSNPKLNQKSTAQPTDNTSSRKGYCFRTAISNSIRQRTGAVPKTPFQGTPKKQQGKPSENEKEKLSTKESSEQSFNNVPDLTFNSDISIIKPARTSFAPSNFIFQPPEGLNNFIFDDDDDCDVYQALEEMKIKFMSRTSTPSKDSGRASSVKSSKESLESNNLVASVEKLDLSNSNDIHVSELMTPVPFKLENDIDKPLEPSSKEPCNEIVYEETDIDINRQVCDKEISVSPIKIPNKEVDAIENQKNNKIPVSPIASLVNEDVNITSQNNEEVNSFSPIKAVESDTMANQEVISLSPPRTVIKEADVIANQMNNEDLSSVQLIKIKETDISASQETSANYLISLASVDVKVDEIINQQTNEEIVADLKIDLSKTETLEKNKNSELQWKKTLDCNNIAESPERNSIEASDNKVQFTHSFKNGTSENAFTDNDLFDNDDSLIDSIDLNKIQLMKLDDENSDEDDFPSPQVLKCAERKSNGAVAKRVSMLKRLSVMNSIAETVETDECHSINSAMSAKNNKVTRNTHRHSKRISKLVSFDILSESPLKNNEDSPSFTPRRSLRLKNVPTATNNYSLSPFKENNTSNIKPRRSMRLIDLSTPEKAACEKLLGENFENLDPNNFLIDFESPTTPTFSKSKKVSLLYSPEKRKSMRKSIKGDLISFSPS